MERKPTGLDSNFAKFVMKYMAAGNVWLYRVSNGRLGGRWRVGAAWKQPVPICLLTHRGRKTGRKRTTPLVYLVDGDAIVVVASQAGRPEHPQWFHNVVADPQVSVQIGAATSLRYAEVADEAQRARLWPRLVELYADYDSYQSWTDREIPVVILRPRTDAQLAP